MSNNQNPADQDHPHEDALAALHGMQSAESKNDHDPTAEMPSSPSSTGLVGMLSKGQLNSGAVDVGGSRSGFAAPMPRGKPQPKLPGDMNQGAKKPGKFDTIGVAKEVKLPEATTQFSTAPSAASRSGGKPMRKIAKPPEWWGAAIPVMYTVSSMLLLISIWAVGACIAMMAGAKSFPLMEVDPDDGTFVSTSKMMAAAMLICLPVSIGIGVMAMILRGKIKTYERKIAAAEG